jgi:hypothetical protein
VTRPETSNSQGPGNRLGRAHRKTPARSLQANHFPGTDGRESESNAARVFVTNVGQDRGELERLPTHYGMNDAKQSSSLSRLISRESLRKTMRSSTWPNRETDGFGCFRQIVAHIGGMTRACLQHRPIHFAFHWHGICRAICPTLDSLPQRRKSGSNPAALDTSMP